MKKFTVNRIYFVFFALICIFLVTYAYAADQPAAEEQPSISQEVQTPETPPGQITCMGTVTAEKNWLGMTKNYVLQQDDGQQFILSRQGKGEQLPNMVGKRIEATGALEESTGKRKIIRIMDITVISEPSE